MNAIILIIALMPLIQREQINKYQFVYVRASYEYNVKYSKVQIQDSGNRNIFEGYTDGYGRIAIKLTKGRYKGTVNYDGRRWPVIFNIDDRRDVKTIKLKGRAGETSESI